MPKRIKMAFTLEVDLDAVPGFGHTPDSFVEHLESYTRCTFGNYNPELEWITTFDPPNKP